MSMAKLIAVIVIVASIASASAFPTRGWGSDEKCDREIEEQTPLRHCEMWVESSSTSPYMGFLRSNTHFQQGEEHKEECCAELQQLSSDCRCMAVRQMKFDDIWKERTACSLPSMCGMTSCACPRI